MAKIKQSIAVQRQIPEHIRENYPVFVEFIKSYYDFLQQTQQQNLETIHDVDTTLDEFIDRFKAELAKNFPIHLATDKAQILKHLREFYLARGSEESFKFLFRVLFNKEAELYYPSKQMLRTSDGRWKQDVSIFIDPEDSNKIDPQSLIGKFIYITNTKGVVVQTVVENAVMYNENVYEVFIEREYINTIDVNFVVSSDEYGTIGKILPCPTTVKVFKSGKGFKVGDIYALRTQLGRGCVIKITKVDAEGGIKNIQVIKFGLDYRTKFYSYLSSKELTTWEYVHPLKINTPYDPNAPAYNEKAAGFIDYGWAAKQTYFYYDTNIPVGDNAYASDRFFADPAYVGDVHQQFYNDASETVMDEDLAIIEIELGSVAKYPGYYQTTNGFISDEMYIQDGSYYQAFSYVVRVEEELRRYADIVKALVHPSGMKIFSEYNIYHDLHLSPKIPRVTTVLQLPLFGNQPSAVTPGDRGIGYTGYNLSIAEDGTTTSTPTEGAASVYSRQGKASLLSSKFIRELIDQPDNIKIKWVEKPLSDITGTSDQPSKDAQKSFADDAITQYLETLVKSYTKNHAEIVEQPDLRSKFLETVKTDLQSVIDSLSNCLSKPLNDQISHVLTRVLSSEKALDDIQEILDVRATSFSRGFEDLSFTEDLPFTNQHKYFASTNITIEDFIAIGRSIVFDDVFTISDSDMVNPSKNVIDANNVEDSLLSVDKAKVNHETINISTNGRLRLQPYDQESYFAVFDDYQPATIIT